MIKNILLTACCSVALFQSACAQDKPSEAQTIADDGTNALTEVADQVSEQAEQIVSQVKADVPTYNAPDAAWRDIDPENTLLIDTTKGRVVLELYPEIAPIHVARIKKLVREDFYDGIVFHRVIEGFMNQTGDPLGNGTGDSPYEDIKAEFSFARNAAAQPVQVLGDTKSKLSDGKTVATGFYKALPVATPADTTFLNPNKPNSYGIHCKGVASMARTQVPDSANSQFFLMRDEYRSLDNEYSIWGATIYGYDVLTKMNVGVVGEPGFEPDSMTKVRLAADLPETERPKLQVLRTDGPEFLNFVDGLRKQTGKSAKICNIQIPSRLK